MLRIDPADIDYVWHSDYHDGPINGLCRYNGQLCWFELDHEAGDYVLSPLKGIAKLRAIAQWRWFEFCVGTHCSHPSGRVFSERKGQWFWRRLANFYYGRAVFKPKAKNSAKP